MDRNPTKNKQSFYQDRLFFVFLSTPTSLSIFNV